MLFRSSRSARTGGYNGTSSSSSLTGGLGVGETETSHIEERKHEANAGDKVGKRAHVPLERLTGQTTTLGAYRPEGTT